MVPHLDSAGVDIALPRWSCTVTPYSPTFSSSISRVSLIFQYFPYRLCICCVHGVEIGRLEALVSDFEQKSSPKEKEAGLFHRSNSDPSNRAGEDETRCCIHGFRYQRRCLSNCSNVAAFASDQRQYQVVLITHSAHEASFYLII